MNLPEALQISAQQARSNERRKHNGSVLIAPVKTAETLISLRGFPATLFVCTQNRRNFFYGLFLRSRTFSAQKRANGCNRLDEQSL